MTVAELIEELQSKDPNEQVSFTVQSVVPAANCESEYGIKTYYEPMPFTLKHYSTSLDDIDTSINSISGKGIVIVIDLGRLWVE